MDLVIYSLATPKRTLEDGTVVSSVLKTIDKPFTTKNLNLYHNVIEQATLEPATEEEIQNTICVMGGEDWKDWIDALKEADVLSQGALTLAYSYLGPDLTYPIYQSGTIGQAKRHLQNTAEIINRIHPDVKAYISVNKAVVTQSSAAIPGVPLYLSILNKVMKEKGLHEDCIMQMVRLFTDRIGRKEIATDEEGRIRLDDLEMESVVQEEVTRIWEEVTTETIKSCCDLDGYWEDFYKIFGFGIKNVDYSQDVEV